MGIRTVATSWEVISKDETGAMVNIDYTCPNCNYDTGELILVGACNVDKIDDGFETDQVCGICDQEVRGQANIIHYDIIDFETKGVNHGTETTHPLSWCILSRYLSRQ